MFKAKALIFGGSGQDGFYLSQRLFIEKIEVISVSRSSGAIRGDVSDFDFVDYLIETYVPEYIFHLAAVSSTRHDAIFENHTAIVTGTLNILEAARIHVPRSKIFLTGSAMQFVNDGSPISELTPFFAGSAYAVARIQSVYAARYFRDRFALSIYIGYLFNHDSARRDSRHVNKIIVDGVQAISRGEKQFLELGDLSVEKEFNHAKDVIEAIWMLVNQNQHHELIIGSGVTHSIEDWVDYCFAKYQLDWKAHIKLRSDFKSEYKKLVSNNALLRSMGWQSQVTFTGLADMMLGLDVTSPTQRP